MFDSASLAVAAVYVPLIGALLAGFWPGSSAARVAPSLATAGVLAAAACSSALFLPHALGFGSVETETVVLARWIAVGPLQADWAVRIDPLSVLMMFVVTLVAAIVHLYSLSYMERDPHRARFFACLSLFTFAMLMLVSADDFLQLFFGWEGVGLASYLLIGFWYRRPAAGAAAIKAFVTNRVGDAAMLLGVLTLLIGFGTLDFDPILAAIAANAEITPLAFGAAAPAPEAILVVFGREWPLLELAGLLLFVGAMGKSAQFLLHVWLPDAMEGPTPVSALIHAATMVTAGVFLVCRMSELYAHAPQASAVIAIVGATTALFAATIAVAQDDIKRVIAYSTCSQLGYMFFAAGLGAYAAAMFHLFTHAFFKALLFLAAGAVIHGFHHEQDMRKMGGLAHRMPFIWTMTLIGTLALTGIGVPGTSFGLAGFFSKDAIIETAWLAGPGLGAMAFHAGLAAALLTSYYSWRLILLVFHGRAKGGARAGEAHDAPPIMRATLGTLALGAVFSGVVFAPAFLGDHLGDHNARFWGEALHSGEAVQHGEAAAGGHDSHARGEKLDAHASAADGHGGETHHVPAWVLWSPLVVSVLGLAAALIGAALRTGSGAPARPGPLRLFLSNKWYFDHLYHAVFVRGAEIVGDLFWKIGDRMLIDGGGPDGMAWLARGGSRGVTRLQSGYVFHYAFVMLLALSALGAWAMLGR